ncbi:FG-GAP repeat domain-containing protein [Pseudoduganella danionis]|uniref:FG-GAP repeat domain-containing protein n=1 Tax=Pseudoduganella danionis TaxID=1890295 RepID=UPI00361310E5
MKFNVSSTAVRSTIPYALPLPINQPANSGLYAAMGSSDIRSYTVADLNNDGFLDIFLHPSYFNYGPALSGVALLNDHKGGFVNATAAIMPGVIFQQSNNVFLADFNHDGRTDMFVVDQGLEIGNPNTGFPGGQNHLYLQDGNGVFQDVTATLPGNAAAFNHVSSMADINGDGNLDIIVTRLGGPNFEGCGTFSTSEMARGSSVSLPQAFRKRSSTCQQPNVTRQARALIFRMQARMEWPISMGMDGLIW